ncbi:MAG: bifunctional phosphopantothenoylcysteine decarboxylase/phosphopantothenate--cysteine ligase CoaBC [Syntrophomonadaceae bacterium]|jgi:phosphopantothenoylcysteine decarboxylase/phosphopantothenate--cysteine ligase|nr:bifunctional phosphopantothenoylcysteine decarboxylase/phosphopantothenate--cysteine ligase CoaBC [Syntrophomonadaceae bacterium]
MSKTVGIGITGGIAAYKMADLVSRLRKDDIEVIVMMTESATRFITPLTFKTLSNREVITDLWQDSQEWPVQHIGIAEELDLLVIAPATANMIAKMTHGIADDLVSTVALANTAPVLIAPAMNSNMYQNLVVQDNLKKLSLYGYEILDPASGVLACGSIGPGRLPEIDIIYQKIIRMLNPKQDLKGKRLMVNAGTTCEDIDPVRFIANRSTGKMGYMIAEEAVCRGAQVILVSGKSDLTPPLGVDYIKAWGAQEMCDIMLKYQPMCDIIIGAAAVGDFKASRAANQKIKKMENKSGSLTLELVSTPDILKTLGQAKKPGQVMVGFAAETQDLIDNAKKKLESKNLDFIVANDVTMEGAGFAADTNIVTIIERNGETRSLPLMSKKEVAASIIDSVVNLLS